MRKSLGFTHSALNSLIRLKMQSPFGSILKLSLAPTRSWLSLGPGWAALAGALSTGSVEPGLTALLQLLGLWLLADLILGTLWELSVQRGLWRSLSQAQLPPPAPQGFYLPYAQPGSLAGRFVLRVRRYGLWWRESFWPERREQILSFGLGVSLALLISLFFDLTFLGLTLLTLGLILLTGQTATDLGTAEGGRLQSVVQLLLPWIMGVVLWSRLTPLSLVLAICYWVTYLGGLRMLGGHRRAEWLFWLGQVAAIGLLLALRLLPGATLLSVLLLAQQIIKTKFAHPPDFLPKAQPYLVLSILAAGWSLGSL
jgi:hypothetical protein